MKRGIKEIDLHGWKLADAEKLFYELLNEARFQRKIIERLFITGTGVIRERFLVLAKEHDCHAYIPLANRGCIIVEFE